MRSTPLLLFLFLLNTTGIFAQFPADPVPVRFGISGAYNKPIMPPYDGAVSGIDKTYWNFSPGLFVQVRLVRNFYVDIGFSKRVTEYRAFTVDSQFSNAGLTGYNLRDIEITTTGISAGFSYAFRFNKIRLSPTLQTNLLSWNRSRISAVYPQQALTDSDKNTTSFYRKPFYGNFRFVQELGYAWNDRFETGIFAGYTFQKRATEPDFPVVFHALDYGISLSFNIRNGLLKKTQKQTPLTP